MKVFFLVYNGSSVDFIRPSFTFLENSSKAAKSLSAFTVPLRYSPKALACTR